MVIGGIATMQCGAVDASLDLSVGLPMPVSRCLPCRQNLPANALMLAMLGHEPSAIKIR